MGCILRLDAWAGSGCTVRHADLEIFVVRKTVTATGFSSSLESLTTYHMLTCYLLAPIRMDLSYLMSITALFTWMMIWKVAFQIPHSQTKQE